MISQATIQALVDTQVAALSATRQALRTNNLEDQDRELLTVMRNQAITSLRLLLKRTGKDTRP